MTRISEIASKIRSYYLKRVVEVIEEFGKGNCETDVALVDGSGQIVVEGGLATGIRIDVVVYNEAGEPLRSIKVDTVNRLEFGVLIGELRHVPIKLGAWKWNECFIFCEGGMSQSRANRRADFF